MTREQFIEQLNVNCKVDNEETWINIIPEINALFDNFESRTCKTCKYLEDIEKSFKYCEENDMNIGHLTWDTFYCSKWESKDEG